MKLLTPEVRIGLVIGQLSQGGAERQITRLAIELAQRSSFKPIVFCMSTYTNPYGKELSKAGITWHMPPNSLKAGFSKLFWLLREVRATNCDLLYGFLNIGNIYAGSAAVLLQLPYIASVRSANSTFSPVIKNLSRFFLNQANVVIGNSNSCIQTLKRDFKITHARIATIPNIITSIDTSMDDCQRLRKKWGVTNEPIVGTIALIKKSKRPQLFMNIFSTLNAEMATHFVWVGDGPEKDVVVRQAASLDPTIQSRIHVEGFQTDISAYLSAFDFFIMTSAFEGSPNALLEAMSAKKVCVVPRVPGIIDVFSDQTDDQLRGILFDSSDPREAVQVISDLWKNKPKMQQISLNAHRWIKEHFSIESIVQANCKIFTSILSTKENS